MKKLFPLPLLLFCSIISQNSFAQQHTCALSKAQFYSTLTSGGPESNPALEDYDVKYVKLDVRLERTSNYIAGNVITKAQVVNGPMGSYVFELIAAINIDSVKINGATANYSRNGDEVTVTCPSSLPQGSIFTSQIYYEGTPPNGGFFNGLSNDVSPSWGNRVTWSLSQPFSAKQWWPVKQSLQDKIDSSDVWITTDSVNKAGSNGMLVNVTTIGNKKRYEWESRHMIDYYLISVAVARYVDYSFYANPVGQPPVLVQNFIYNNPQTLPYFQQDIDETGDMIEFFATVYGPYPFGDEKYGHCMAPFSGGMEHQTMTTQGSFSRDLTAHELGHQWFGDHVTCAYWRDIWVNEGFASYSEYLYNESLSATDARNWMDYTHNDVMSQPGGSVYVDDTTNINRIFSGRLTYGKGAAILHTLRFVMNNDSLFFATLQQYQQQYGHSTATGDDFKNVAATVSGINLNTFFQQWYYGEGYLITDLQYYWDPVSHNFYLNVNQTGSAPGVTPMFDTPLEVKVDYGVQDTTYRINLTQASETFLLQLPAAPVQITVDPNQWVLDSVGTITQNVVLGQENTEAAALQIFPNPAQEYIDIYYPGISGLRIFDMNGKEVFTAEAGAIGQYKVSVKDFAPGAYTVVVNNTYREVFLKQ